MCLHVCREILVDLNEHYTTYRSLVEGPLDLADRDKSSSAIHLATYLRSSVRSNYAFCLEQSRSAMALAIDDPRKTLDLGTSTYDCPQISISFARLRAAATFYFQ